MTKAKDASMRRIAIVLASLPQPLAQRLLGSLQGDSQRQVRAALGTLDDVDPLERRRALDGFANSLRRDSTKSQSSDAAEVVFSKAALRSLSERNETNPITTPAPLAFLLDVDDETLIAHLLGEMPQTLAIVLASISPAQAARVLPRLDAPTRADAMRRMANLQELPTELIEEIGSQLRSRLVPAAGHNQGAGRQALDAILAEMPNEIQSRNTPIQHAPRAEPIPPTTAVEVTPPQVKLAEGTWPDDATSRASSPLSSTDAIHDYLVSLPIDRLRETLGKVPVRQALLTICGLPNSTAEAVLASLPRRQAKLVRDQLGALGSLQLRDIDEAKEVVAKTAYKDKVSDISSRIAVAA